MSEHLLNTRNLVKIAILSAIAFALMFFEFPLPFIAPPFYQIDFEISSYSSTSSTSGPFRSTPNSPAIKSYKILYFSTTSGLIP